MTKALVATEETTNTNEVMIIGLSEKSNLRSSGLPVESGGLPVASKTKGGWSANITYIKETRAVIDQMSIKDHKESWAAGASEVAANGGVRWRAPGGLNPYNPPNNTPDVSRTGPNGALPDYDAGGYSVADWSRSEVGVQRFKYPNFRLVDYWNPYWYPTPDYRGPVGAFGDTAGFIIYEADAWPAGLKPVEWRLPVDFSTETVNIAVQYRSSDDFYHKGTITRDDTKLNNSTGYSSEPVGGGWVYGGVFDKGIFFYDRHHPITNAIEFRIVGEEI